jgi:hypothetical protein
MVNFLLLSIAHLGLSMTAGGSHLAVLSGRSESASLIILATGLFACSALARRVGFSRKATQTSAEGLATPEAATLPTPGVARLAPATAYQSLGRTLTTGY